MDTNSYVMFLIVGTAIVVADGQMIYRAGRGYLARPNGDDASAVSMARLVSVLFHLAVLGVLALISTIDVSARNPLEGVVMRLGVVLLLVAIAHGIAIKALTMMRDRLDLQEMTESRQVSVDNNANRVYRKATIDVAPPLTEHESSWGSPSAGSSPQRVPGLPVDPA